MSTVTTTIKTETCSFSEYRVYPGRGQKFIARDGKVYFFINGKSAAFHKRKAKPAKLKWTLSWRKANKKYQTELSHRKRSKRSTKLPKAIVGLTLEELKTKKAIASKNDAKATVRQALLMETKEKAKKSRGPLDTQKSVQPVAPAKASFFKKFKGRS